MGKPKEKKLRRDQVKYPSLVKKYNSRIRQEYLDLDYIDQLDDTKKNCKLPDGTMVTEMEYMALFMKEWNAAGVGKQSEAEQNAFHRTAQEVKDCTDRNNARNWDLYGNLRNKVDVKIPKLLDYEELVNHSDPDKALENQLSKEIDPRRIEDSYIEFLESKEVEAWIQEYDQAMRDFREPIEAIEIQILSEPQSAPINQ